MARVVNIENLNIVGSQRQIEATLASLKGDGAAIVNVERATFIVSNQDVDAGLLETALSNMQKFTRPLDPFL